MTSKIKQGMHLRQPENSSDGAWIFQTLAAMLACAALMFALAALAGFRTGNLLPILLAAGGYVCIAYGVTIRFQKQQWFFLAALAVPASAGSHLQTAGAGRLPPVLESDAQYLYRRDGLGAP